MMNRCVVACKRAVHLYKLQMRTLNCTECVDGTVTTSVVVQKSAKTFSIYEVQFFYLHIKRRTKCSRQQWCCSIYQTYTTKRSWNYDKSVFNYHLFEEVKEARLILNEGLFKIILGLLWYYRKGGRERERGQHAAKSRGVELNSRLQVRFHLVFVHGAPLCRWATELRLYNLFTEYKEMCQLHSQLIIQTQLHFQISRPRNKIWDISNHIQTFEVIKTNLPPKHYV